MIVHPHILQGSEAWERLRTGRPTASRFSDIITAAKGELSKSAQGYMVELISQCFCPGWSDFLGNKWTDRGTEMEPEAREAFIQHTGLNVVQVGFCTRDDTVAGCSPDGLIVDADGNYIAGIEIKSPSPKVHIGYILDGKLPNDYKQQVHGSMAVTGLNEWHFWSYYPGIQPFHIVVQRDEYTEKVSASLDSFLIDYAALRAKLIPKVQLVG